MKINCIAIEDEPLALKKIEEFIGMIDYLNLMKAFNNGIDAIGYLKTNMIDLIFLDIRMKKLSGIQLLESLQYKPKVIITSAYNEYALKGYELDVADYLLKPFTFERFLKSVEKIYSQFWKNASSELNECIFLKTEYRIEKVMIDDILFIKGMKDYLQVHTTSGSIMTLQTFRNMLDILPQKNFIRVHNSYMVSIPKIDNIERNRIRIGNDLIPISDSYKDAFYRLLSSRNFLL